MFPPSIWNHYETIGPKTNNHVEGLNFKLNQYSFCSHPNIYQLIELFRQMETNISKKYIKRVKGVRSKVYRRPIDVKRDENLSILKSLVFYNSISLNNYLLYCSKLFRYDESHQQICLSDIYNFLDIEHPIDLYYIQMTSFAYIKNYIYLNRPQFIDMVILLRNQCLTEYNGQLIDSDYNYLIKFYSTNYVGLYTTKDGDCLFPCSFLEFVWFGSV